MSLVKRDEPQVAPSDLAIQDRDPGSLLQAVMRIASDPNVKIEVIERMVALHERMVADQRKVAFDEAMVRLQAKIPQIEKYGKSKNSKFAKYEDIEALCKPLWIAEGFSLSFNEEERTESTVKFALEVSRAGHSKIHRLTVSIDKASKNSQGVGIRPAIQDDGSTASYARRYLVKLALDVVEKDEDTDGEDKTTITEDQALDLKAQVEASGMNLDKFLVYMKVGKFMDVLASDKEKAQTVIRAAIAEKKK